MTDTLHAAAPSGTSRLDEETPFILVVDDDRRIRELLKKYLSDNGYRVAIAESAAEARTRMESLAFDLVVLDVMMPGETGIELTSALRATSDIPILLLTARAETEHRIEGLESGADDYLPKPFEPKELLLRIRTILKRVTPPETVPTEIRLGPCRYDLNRQELRRDGELIRLTDREIQLMQIFTERPNETLARSLLMGADASTERAIDVQINRLRRKIERDPRNPVYLQTVRGLGYILKPD